VSGYAFYSSVVRIRSSVGCAYQALRSQSTLVLFGVADFAQERMMTSMIHIGRKVRYWQLSHVFSMP